MTIKNKIIIVTGASQGIGRALAQLLASRGATVVLSSRDRSKLDELQKELPDSYVISADMRKPEDIKKLIAETVKKYGRVDILINNAGQGMYGPVKDIDINNYKDIMELNVYGPLRAMQEVIPVMRKQGGGMIVNISSRVSKNYFSHLAAYASTKYALNAISLTARQELAEEGIIVSVMHPKMTATDFGKNAVGEHPSFQQINSQRAASSPQRPQRPNSPAMEIDTAEAVAERTLDLIESEQPEAEM